MRTRFPRRKAKTLGARINMKYLCTLLLIVSLSGCCMFVPCHPATRAVGYVTDLDGTPIKNATVMLYGYQSTTNGNGCFAFDVPDALPFKLSASAEGFKDVEGPSKAGFFTIYVRLAPSESSESSGIRWKEISRHEYENINKCT